MNLGRLSRFAIIGVVNTAIYFACYLLLRMVVVYMVAHVFAMVIAMICSYFLNCYITFRTKPRWRTFLLYPLSNVANMVVTTVGLPIAVQWFHIDERIAPLPVALTAIPITYVVAHRVMIGRLRHPNYRSAESHHVSPSSVNDDPRPGA